MLFLTPKQIKTLSRLNGRNVESFVIEMLDTATILITIWGFDSKSRQFTINTDGKYREVLQSG